MKIGTLLGALVGGTLMFLIGFLFFGILFADYFRANAIQYAGLEKDPPVMWAIFLFNLAWGALIAFVLDYAGRGGWAEGAKVGAIVMFILAVGMDLEFHAFMNLHKDLAPMLLHVLIVTFMGAVSGAAVGLVSGYFNRQAVEA